MVCKDTGAVLLHEEREGLTQVVRHLSVRQQSITQLPGDPSCAGVSTILTAVCVSGVSCSVFFAERKLCQRHEEVDVESSKFKRTMEKTMEVEI